VPGGGALRRIPFGPFLLAGFWAALSLSPVLEA
jgi:prepilin signal peptidase PulO-like enzyme (type II secretory pathway)